MSNKKISDKDRKDVKKEMDSYYKNQKDYYTNLLEYENRVKNNLEEYIPYIEKANSILDVGCGSGTLCLFLSKKYPDKKICGVDISPQGINLAKKEAMKNNCKIEYKLSDIEKKIDFNNNHFDLVISHEVIEHLNYPENMIKEVWRVCKSKGIAIIIAPNLFLFSPLRIKFSKIIDILLNKQKLTFIEPDLQKLLEDNDAIYLTTPWEIRKMLTKTGFKIINIIRSYFSCKIIAQKR